MRLRFSDISISVALKHEVLSHSINNATLNNAVVCLLTPCFTLKACVKFQKLVGYSVGEVTF